jgi:hypothetical protein
MAKLCISNVGYRHSRGDAVRGLQQRHDSELAGHAWGSFAEATLHTDKTEVTTTVMQHLVVYMWRIWQLRYSCAMRHGSQRTRITA